MMKNNFFRMAVVGTVALMMGINVSCRMPQTIDLSGDEILKEYFFSDFHGIKASSIYDVRLIRSEKDSVCVHADSALFPYLEIKKRDGILVFGFKESVRMDFQTSIRAEVFYTGTLDWLEASGAAKITVDSILHTDKLGVRLSGAAKMKGRMDIRKEMEMQMSGASHFKGDFSVTGNALFGLSGASHWNGHCTVTGQADIKISGASGIKWEGYVEKAGMEISGSGNIEGYDMQIDDLSVVASGASGLKVTVNRKLDARASGSADIHYRGTPEVRSQTSGAGSVSRSR